MMEMLERIKGWRCLLCAGILALGSCSNEELLTVGSGIRVSLADEVEVTSRSTPAELGKPLVTQFRLTVTKQGRTDAVYDGGYTSELIQVPAGTYDLKATFGTNPELSLDSPYYEGSAVAEVTADAETQTSIACQVGNALVSVKFGNQDKFDAMYSLYGIKVQVGDLYVRLSNTNSSQSAYFRAGSSPQLSFYGTLKESGQDVSMIIENENLPKVYAARDHAILTLSAKPVTSGTILTVDTVEVEKVSVTETIPMEWMPKPKVTGFGGKSTLEYIETADAPTDAVVSYTTSMPVQDVEITLDFNDTRYNGYNKTYTLSALTAEERTALSGIGISLPTLDGVSTSGTLDLNAFAGNLLTDNGAEVVNTVKVRVKANNRWSSDEGESYTIHVKKPEFSIAVQPGNMWSKEFTADEITVTSGNAERVKVNLVYQYSADGGSTWHDCSDGLTQKFSTHPDNKDYKVRACYRNCIYSNNVADATLEAPIQLPNSDMEEWYIESKKKTGFMSSAKTYYTFHPYANGAASSSWWDTNNDKAQGGTLAFGIWYPGCFASCVSYTEDVHGGSKAALMYLSGCGDNYANTAGTYVGGAMVGSLFIGSYNSGIVQGHAFTSRPESLSFWYKYKPYDSDAFQVVVSLKNGDETIATGTYVPVAYTTEDASYQQATVDLTWLDESKKATMICVQFLASNKTTLSGSDFAWGTTINYPTIGNWTVHMGSVLKIDDLSLNYTK